jgi:hypothetical protein
VPLIPGVVPIQRDQFQILRNTVLLQMLLGVNKPIPRRKNNLLSPIHHLLHCAAFQQLLRWQQRCFILPKQENLQIWPFPLPFHYPGHRQPFFNPLSEDPYIQVEKYLQLRSTISCALQIEILGVRVSKMH